jgi:hypothetical protein
MMSKLLSVCTWATFIRLIRETYPPISESRDVPSYHHGLYLYSMVTNIGHDMEFFFAERSGTILETQI